MTAGPSGRRDACEGAPCVGLTTTDAVALTLAEADEVGAFEGDGAGDAAINVAPTMLAPRTTISASAIGLFREVGKEARDWRRAAVDSGKSMTRQRTLSLADRVFRYELLAR